MNAASSDPSIAPSVLASVSAPVAAPASAMPTRSRSPSAVNRNPESSAAGARNNAQSSAAPAADCGCTGPTRSSSQGYAA